MVEKKKQPVSDNMITGKTLIEWGFKPGSWFRDAIKALNEAGDIPYKDLRRIAADFESTSTPLRKAGLPYHVNLKPDNPIEQENLDKVKAHMNELMKVPTVVTGAVMPDACPVSSTLGVIPVGAVVATKDAIHPGMHSADVCCSMAVTVLGDVDPTKVLDLGMERSHFGGGGRSVGDQVFPSTDLMSGFNKNPFLRNLQDDAIAHHATQGDGNHFFFVGRMKSSGDVCLVTHHGSRKPGAMLYKKGMRVAENFRQKLSPETHKHNAWIPFETFEGRDYWQALQLIRLWTKSSHFAIHDLILEGLGVSGKDRFWNEHNFVFERDGLFYHAKGATPAYADFSDDTNGLTLIPLNMAEPILVAKGLDAEKGVGFAPHGAGRNFSRRQFEQINEGRTAEEIIKEQAPGIDVRFFNDQPDISELPGAYKNAAKVRAEITEHGLAEIVDEIEPIGSIMAGHWRKKLW